mmetsp:Transcript_57893/g.134881  ORF Transcript_57893/g.134881 Transcript_57893/m.134881 type:complete len:484 (+) Transcript_57893:36-1487(+)
MRASGSTDGARKSVHFEERTDTPVDGKPVKEDEMGRKEFLELFSDYVTKRDFQGALQACRKRLKVKPDDRYVLQLRQSVERFLDAAEDLEEEDDTEEPPTLEELQERCQEASERACEAMFTYLQDENRLWALGEQAVGIFWDVGQVAPWGRRRERLLHMSKALIDVLGRRLQSEGHHAGAMPAMAVSSDTGTGEWLSEGLGQLWWRCELGLERSSWLIDGCRDEWIGKSTQELTGCSLEDLRKASLGDLCDVLVQTWTLERSLVCGLFGERPPPPLEYGVGVVLAEVRRRPLIEPPLPGFYDCFYLMTHVVYVLNCFNGHLPNNRTDCPWLYAYLERALAFWLREANNSRPGLPPDKPSLWGCEAVDAVAEAVDCLRGLDEGEGQGVREGLAWLLSRQEADGFFYSPQAQRPADNEYDYLHPTWTAVAALQLDREVPGSSPRCAAWAQHARQAAIEGHFAQAPPLPDLGAVAAQGEEEESEEG